MAAYVIGEVEVTKPEVLGGYAQLIEHAVEKFGGTYLVHGVKPRVLEGGPAHNLLIIAFPSVDVAQRWYDSPEYGAAKAMRQGASNLRLVVVDDGKQAS